MKKSVAKVIVQLAMSNIELQDQIEVMENRMLGHDDTPSPEVHQRGAIGPTYYPNRESKYDPDIRRTTTMEEVSHDTTPTVDPRDDPERGAAATIQRYMDLSERWRTLCVEVQRGAAAIVKLASGWDGDPFVPDRGAMSAVASFDIIKRLATDMQKVDFKFDQQSYKEEE